MSMPRRFLETTTTATAAMSPVAPMSRDSDVVVILAALLCAVICVVGLALVARCAWLRRNAPPTASATAVATIPPPSPNKGIKKKVLRSIPTLSFQEALASEEDGGRKMSSDCAICLAEFAEGDEIRVLPQCGHGFHVGCVDVWLGSHSSCPSCRRVLVAVAAAATGRCQRCGAAGAAPETPAEEVAVTVVVEDEDEERKANGDGSGSGFLP